MVLFAHASLGSQFPGILRDIPGLFLDGRLGVRVFFVISGFLITTLLLNEFASTGRINLWAFYQRRAFRILPVYYVYWTTVLILVGVCGTQAISWQTYLAALSFTTHFWGEWGPSSWPLLHSWSLAIEEQFYLFWPALFLCLGPRVAGRIWISLMIVIAPIIRHLIWKNPVQEHLFVTQADSIAFGCLLAMLGSAYSSRMGRFFRFQPAVGRVCAVLLIYAPVIARLVIRVGYGPRIITFFPTIQCIAIAYLIGSYLTVESGIGFYFLNLAGVKWIGRLSYSLYIWQQSVLIPAAFEVYPPSWRFASWIRCFPQNLLAVFILAAMSYYLVEQPFLALRKKLKPAKSSEKSELPKTATCLAIASPTATQVGEGNPDSPPL
jgi:peptidoglycan/LPS O-acetylase OafA/YrhL